MLLAITGLSISSKEYDGSSATFTPIRCTENMFMAS